MPAACSARSGLEKRGWTRRSHRTWRSTLCWTRLRGSGSVLYIRVSCITGRVVLCSVCSSPSSPSSSSSSSVYTVIFPISCSSPLLFLNPPPYSRRSFFFSSSAFVFCFVTFGRWVDLSGLRCDGDGWTDGWGGLIEGDIQGEMPHSPEKQSRN